MTPAELVAASKLATTLVLSEDVKTPQPDRRATRDWRLSPTIAKGTGFYVVTEPGETAIRIYAVGAYSHVAVLYRADGTVPPMSSQAALAAALLPMLTVGRQTLGSISARHYMDVNTAAAFALRRLIKTGRVTLAEVDAILTADEGEE